MNSASPLEYLAAFVITFALGVALTIGLEKYVARVKRDAKSAIERAP